jgi:hypothetical protein
MLVALAAGVVAVAALFAAPAGAGPKQGKEYQMFVVPEEWAGVTDGSFSIKLVNRTGTQQLGSADITVPAEMTIVDRDGIGGSGNKLELRNLGLEPNETLPITIGLRMPCVAETYTWEVEAKQSNDFSGPPGNTLGPVSGTLDTKVEGTCSLRFVHQPAGALKTARITADPFQPDSINNVAVEALDGSPAPQRLDWFTDPIALASGPTAPPLTSSPAVDGLATFENLRIVTVGTYTLHATTTAAGVDPDDSSPFPVVDVAKDCDTAGCEAKLDAAKSSDATLVGTPTTGAGFALLSLNSGPDPLTAPACKNHYTPPAPEEYYEFQLSGVAAPTMFTVEYTPEAMKKFKGGHTALDACLAVPGPDNFIAKDELPAASFDYDGDPTNGVAGFAGLLPDCPDTPVKPCEFDTDSIPGGGASITIFVPADLGDPRMH